MASINAKKIKSINRAIGLLKHNDKEQRKQNNHSNKQIDKSLTDNNTMIYKASIGKSYDDISSHFKNRISDFDAVSARTRRKDAVVMLSFESIIPDGISRSNELKFMKDVASYLNTQLGDENLLAAYLHRDEIHDYIDVKTNTRVQSKHHFHLNYMCFDEDNNLNLGSKFMTKANLKKMNSAIDKIAVEKYGVVFNTGEYKGVSRKVEDLKYNSVIKEIEELEIERDALKAEKDKLKQEILEYKDLQKKNKRKSTRFVDDVVKRKCKDFDDYNF
jgi:hypothetical protein